MPSFDWSSLSDQGSQDQLINVMHATNLFESKGAIRRLIAQGGVKVDGEKDCDPQKIISTNDKAQIFQAGKRIFFKIN